MDIYVSSLPFKLKEAGLKALFETHGEVESVKIIIDKITRQSKGFGFVTMPNEEEAKVAIEALHGSELDGRILIVSESQQKLQSSVKDSKSKKTSSAYFKGIGKNYRKK
ncbi:MAG: RNA recognition motif domain-containing protein [Flectobacillus sp.]|uniref:RNA recognition motif domain-containing protein n=1 Tax=Flectobacillus sp. TaxID=50419 RepID=UPI003B9BF95B